MRPSPSIGMAAETGSPRSVTFSPDIPPPLDDVIFVDDPEQLEQEHGPYLADRIFLNDLVDGSFLRSVKFSVNFFFTLYGYEVRRI